MLKEGIDQVCTPCAVSPGFQEEFCSLCLFSPGQGHPMLSISPEDLVTPSSPVYFFLGLMNPIRTIVGLQTSQIEGQRLLLILPSFFFPNLSFQRSILAKVLPHWTVNHSLCSHENLYVICI